MSAPAGDSPWQWHRLGAAWLGSSSGGKVLVGRELDRRPPRALAARDASRALGSTTRSTARRWSEGTLPLYLELVRPHPEHCVHFPQPQCWKVLASWSGFSEGP